MTNYEQIEVVVVLRDVDTNDSKPHRIAQGLIVYEVERRVFG